MAGTPQVIFGGMAAGVGAWNGHAALFGIGYNMNRTANDRYACLASPPGTLQNFYVALSQAPGAGTSHTYTIYKNGATTGITVTISGTDTSGSDTAHTDTLSPGDRVTVYHTYSGAPTSGIPTWHCEFDPTTANNYWLGGSLHASTSAARYGSLYAGVDASALEAVMQAPIPVAGTIKNFYVGLDVDPGTAPDYFVFHIRQNGANSGVYVTITADDKTGNDTVNTVAVAAGDTVNVMAFPYSTPSAAVWGAYGCTIVVSTSGLSPVLWMPGPLAAKADLTNAEYQVLAGAPDSTGLDWQAAETYYTLGALGTLKKLYVHSDTAPSAGKGRKFEVRVAGSNTGITCTVSDANTDGNDTTHTYSVTEGQALTMITTPQSGPIADGYWTFGVGFESPSGAVAEEGLPTNILEAIGLL